MVAWGTQFSIAASRFACARALPSRRSRDTERLIVPSGVLAAHTEHLRRAVDRDAAPAVPRVRQSTLRPIGSIGHRHLYARDINRFPLSVAPNTWVQ